MREFKFRAFTEDEGILNNVYIGTDDYTDMLNSTLKYLQEFNDCKLMQYTGLKDKEGNEIYEGDIVEIEHHKFKIMFELGSYMLVKLSEDTCMYELFSSCWNDDVYLLSQHYWESNHEDEVINDCVIIGNIYENPELLEGDE